MKLPHSFESEQAIARFQDIRCFDAFIFSCLNALVFFVLLEARLPSFFLSVKM